MSVAAGTYTNQPDLAVAKAVTFHATGTVDLSGSHPSMWETGSGFTLDGFTFPNGFYIRPGASNITITKFHSLDCYITSASTITWSHGECTGQNNNDGGQIKSTGSGGVIPSNITLDDVSVHDVTRTDGTSHTDCLQVGAVNGMVVKHSRFYNCATQGLFFDPIFDTDSIKNLTIENNFFGTVTQGTRALVFGAVAGPVSVRFNSFGTSSVGGGSASNNISFVGNVGHISNCTTAFGTGITFSYDRWIGTACSATDTSITAAQLWASESSNDLHLLSTSPAKNYVPTSVGCPVDDIDGQARPQGTQCDAGADEAG